jgi:hypothetical protein
MRARLEQPMSFVLASLIVALGCTEKTTEQQPAAEQRPATETSTLARFEEAQIEQAKVQVRAMVMSVEMYRLQHGTCPATLEELVAAKIVRQLDQDPWGNDYVLRCPGEHDEVDISSSGKDREPGTADDIHSWALDQPSGG